MVVVVVVVVVVVKKSRSFLLNRHLYENNYLPITGYDETAGIQFVDRLMII